MNDDERAAAIGAALRRARGSMDQTEAARRSGVSRQWWIDTERGVRIPRPGKLLQAILAVDGDPAAIFKLAGYDLTPYRDQIAEHTAKRRHAAMVEEALDALLDGLDDDLGPGQRANVTQLLSDIAEELRAVRQELRQLGDAVEQLVAPPPSPPAAAASSPPREAPSARAERPSTSRSKGPRSS